MIPFAIPDDSQSCPAPVPRHAKRHRVTVRRLVSLSLGPPQALLEAHCSFPGRRILKDHTLNKPHSNLSLRRFTGPAGPSVGRWRSRGEIIRHNLLALWTSSSNGLTRRISASRRNLACIRFVAPSSKSGLLSEILKHRLNHGERQALFLLW